MSAAAREILHALQTHPFSAPKSGGRVIFVCAEESLFRQDLFSLLSEHYQTDLLCPPQLSSPVKSHFYDAAVLSNVFVDQKCIEEKEKILEILHSLVPNLKDGAVVIVRENIVKNSVRLISDLTKLLDLFISIDNCRRRQLIFEFYAARQLQDSIFAHSNFLDIFWTLSVKQKEIEEGTSNGTTFRDFLDKTQYAEDNVKSYEWIFGQDFISPGGKDENLRILKKFSRIYPGQKMLDIGVGIGGGARQSAREFGLHVIGADLSSNMIMHAFERNQRDKDHRVEYQICDALVFQYEPNTFDLIFSRDCVQHIKDMTLLFKNIYTWLKPGGQMLITMYGKGRGELKANFLNYVNERQYYLNGLEECEQLAKNTGFIEIHTENMTDRFKQILQEERRKTLENKDEFVQFFGRELFEKAIVGWENKIGYIEDDNHNWLLIRANKP